MYKDKLYKFVRYVGYNLLLLWWILGLLFACYIIYHYPIGGRWKEALPNLDKNLYNRICMQLHFIGGIIVQILGPVQLVPQFRKWEIFNTKIHRWTGRVYLLGMCGTFLGGEMFMFANPTVGGLNMTIAFGMYGICFLFCGGMAFYYARRKQFRQHMYWALLTLCLGIGSLIYRGLYLFSFVCGYHLHNVEDFMRPLDQIFDWLFFIPNMLVTCLVILVLHCRYTRNSKLKYNELEKVEEQC